MEKESLEIYNKITKNGFNMEYFEANFPKFDQTIETIDSKIQETEKILNQLKEEKKQIVYYKEESKLHMNNQMREIQMKLAQYVGQQNTFNNQLPLVNTTNNTNDENEDEEEDNVTLHSTISNSETTPSYLTMATKKSLPNNVPVKQTYKTYELYLTTDVIIHGLISNAARAPYGHLFYDPTLSVFGMKFHVGGKDINMSGNIGNLFVRGDIVKNVDLCRQSEKDKSCLKLGCTFRHEPPKKGEVRNFFSAITYQPPRMDSLSKDIRGSHRIGSREHLAKDLQQIRRSESYEAYDAYMVQAFHTLLVAFAMESGQVCKPRENLPIYMDPEEGPVPI